MIMSAEREKQIRIAFQQVPKEVKEVPTEVQKTMLNTTIKLTGNNGKDDFLASGVILYQNEYETLIVTAKHNLSIFAGLPAHPHESPDGVKDLFLKVSIGYGEGMKFNGAVTNSAPITSIESIQPEGSGPWDYDVILLKSSDANLMKFAEANFIYAPYQADLGFLTKPALFLKKGEKQAPPWFFQTGYGFVTENAGPGNNTTLPTATRGGNKKGFLQYRVAQPLAPATVQCYQEVSSKDYAPVIHAIQLAADPNDSSAPGDSGGPLFVVTNNNKVWRCDVIGVTYGADLADAQKPCPPSGKLRVNNISTSLDYCYREGLI